MIISWARMVKQGMSGLPLIAIVDDDVMVCEATKDLVETFGFEARTFISADEFLNSDCVAGISCLIADVQMPGTNGLEFHRKLVVSGSPHPGNLHYRLPGRAGSQTSTEGWCSLLPEQAVRRGEPAQLDPRCAGIR